VRPGEAPKRLHLPERAGARLEEVLVEQALVEAAIPARGVEIRERVPTLAHAHDGGFPHALLRIRSLVLLYAGAERPFEAALSALGRGGGEGCRKCIHKLTALCPLSTLTRHVHVHHTLRNSKSDFIVQATTTS